MSVTPVSAVAPQRSNTATPSHYCCDTGWKMDPELELWVDVENSPINIRLKGTLDGRTCTSLRSVIEELLDEGYDSVTMEIDELELPDAAGFSSLTAIQSLVRQAGGTLHWSSWPAEHVTHPVS